MHLNYENIINYVNVYQATMYQCSGLNGIYLFEQKLVTDVNTF